MSSGNQIWNYMIHHEVAVCVADLWLHKYAARALACCSERGQKKNIDKYLELIDTIDAFQPGLYEIFFKKLVDNYSSKLKYVLYLKDNTILNNIIQG